MARVRDALRHAWNVFVNRDVEQRMRSYGEGSYYSAPPNRTRMHFSNERTIIASIYTRMAVDVAAIPIRHIRINDEEMYVEDVKSGLNECLLIEANIDQAGRALRQDIAMTLFDSGVAAIVPVDTDLSPNETGGYDIRSMRVGKVVAWFPRHVQLDLYNDATGLHEQITLEKKNVAIVENPFYAVMNENNSTLKRLIRKLNLLDLVDEQSSSGKLDIIVQVPYTIRSEERREYAKQRKKDIEFQLKGSQYGIAYIDGTEKVTQLNRPAENNLMQQIVTLTEMLYNQLGLTEEIMSGTADEKTMLNYYNRTIEPLLGAIADAITRSFLTKTARSQKQTIAYYRDPFKLAPIEQIAEIADKFTRNEIFTSNEMRSIMGRRPSSDPKANKLVNSNMPQPEETATEDESSSIMQDAFDQVDSMLDEAFSILGEEPNVGG